MTPCKRLPTRAGPETGQVFGGLRTPALGADVTSVKCGGQWLPLGLSVDATTGLALTVDALPGEDAARLQAWLTPVAEAVGAQLLVSDDADAFKLVADQLGLDQQVCKAHVRRNTQALVESLMPLAAVDRDGSLATLGVKAAQAVTDLKRLGDLVHSRQPQQVVELADLAARYAPGPGARAGPSRQPGLSAAATIPGSLELVGTPDLLPHLARARGPDAGWHQ